MKRVRNNIIILIIILVLSTSFITLRTHSSSHEAYFDLFDTTTYMSSSGTNVTGWGNDFLELPRQNPVYLDFLEVGIPRNVFVSGDYAYTGDFDGLFISDVSNPENLMEVSNYTDETYVDYITDCEINGNLAYLSNGNDGLLVLDVTNKNNPTYYSSLDLPSVSSDILLHNSRAYIPVYSGGLRVVNIANPAVPYDEVGVMTATSGDAYGVAISGDYLYIAVHSAGLDVFNITTPSNPTFVSNLDLDGYAKRVEISGNYAYVAADLGGLQIVDISDPTNMTRVVHLDDNTRYNGVYIENDYVFVAGYLSSDSFMKIYDITDPENPLEVGFYEFGDSAFDVFVSGDYFYVAVPSAGLYSFRYAESGDPYGEYYASYAIATSSTVYVAPVGEELERVLLIDSVYLETGTSIKYYVSADGGLNWENVTVGVEYYFINRGRYLQWKAEFFTTDSTLTPKLYWISMDFYTVDVELELLYPSNGAYVNDLTPSFDWEDMPGAYGYYLQVDNSSSFSNPGVSEQLMFHDSSYTIDLELNNGSTYYWRVAYYIDFDNIGDYSSIQSFTVGIEPTVSEFNFVPLSFALISFIGISSSIIISKRKK